MKIVKYLFILTAGFGFIFSSCTIKKRTYRPGYFIVWKKSARTKGNDFAENKHTAIKSANPDSTSVAKIEPPLSPQDTVQTRETTNSTVVPLSEYTKTLKKQSPSKGATKDVSSFPGKKSKKIKHCCVAFGFKMACCFPVITQYRVYDF